MIPDKYHFHIGSYDTTLLSIVPTCNLSSITAKHNYSYLGCNSMQNDTDNATANIGVEGDTPN